MKLPRAATLFALAVIAVLVFVTCKSIAEGRGIFDSLVLGIVGAFAAAIVLQPYD